MKLSGVDEGNSVHLLHTQTFLYLDDHLVSVDKAAEELDVAVLGQLAEVAVRHVAVLVVALHAAPAARRVLKVVLLMTSRLNMVFHSYPLEPHFGLIYSEDVINDGSLLGYGHGYRAQLLVVGRRRLVPPVGERRWRLLRRRSKH